MTQARLPGRRNLLLGLSAAAGFGALAGAATFLPAGRSDKRSETGTLVIPEFAQQSDNLRLIMVTTREEFYHIARTDTGWVLTEKDLHPVRPDRMRDLAEALATMRFGEAKTRDERKFDSIGLGDPAAGGAGALLEVGDGHGAAFAKLIIGYRNGTSYLRAPDDLQAWEVVSAVLPPLQRAVAWLDLAVLDIVEEEIASVEVQKMGEAPYGIALRDGELSLLPPQPRRANPLALQGIAGLTARFAPIDVAAPSSRAPMQTSAVHLTRTTTGLEVALTAMRHKGEGWVAVRASSTAPESAQRAERINARAGNWIFRLSEPDWRLLATPFPELLR